MAYNPTRPPPIDTLEQLYQYVEDEFKALSKALLENTEVELQKSFVEPLKPRDGMIVYADGSEWDPGSGEGFYGYENGSWVKL